MTINIIIVSALSEEETYSASPNTVSICQSNFREKSKQKPHSLLFQLGFSLNCFTFKLSVT